MIIKEAVGSISRVSRSIDLAIISDLKLSTSNKEVDPIYEANPEMWRDINTGMYQDWITPHLGRVSTWIDPQDERGHYFLVCRQSMDSPIGDKSIEYCINILYIMLNRYKQYDICFIMPDNKTDRGIVTRAIYKCFTSGPFRILLLTLDTDA